MHTNLCSGDFEMLFWTLWTCANHSESFVTWRHCAWRMIFDVQLSSEPTCIASLQKLQNTCYVHYTPLRITQVSNKGLSADTVVCLRIAVLFLLTSIRFSTVKWSKQEVLTGGNISRDPLALRFWLYEVHWLIYCNENTVLRIMIRTVKHDARNIS